MNSIHTNQDNRFKEINSIELVKRKFDSFSYIGIIGIIGTAYYLLFDNEDFLTNMQELINLIPWLIVISYPVIRYVFPFHTYKLDYKGITLKKGEFIKWSEIKTLNVYDNYEEEKDSDTPIYKLVINLKTHNDHKIKINLSNYTIKSHDLRARIKPLLNENFKMKDALFKIFYTFYQKYKNTPNQSL